MPDLLQDLSDRSSRAARAHKAFLDSRGAGLQQLASLLRLQQRVLTGQPANAGTVHPPALFSLRDLEEFATGSMARCFGPEFEVFTGRRHPRIPNGDLMLMSRVLTIQGVRGKHDQPAEIVAEYDVPAAAWFLDPTNPVIPISILMEISLQPCGLLSAYLGTALLTPEIDFYFRNLDGQCQVLTNPDLRGQTITCRARQLSTISNGTTIIQRYTFTLSSSDQVFFKGESAFGYFSPDAMSRQAGLDSGGSTAPLGAPPAAAQLPLQPVYRSLDPRMQLVDSAQWVPGAGKLGGGLVHAVKALSPNAWYYPCHFLGDPVMPGSLGVEAIFLALQAYARSVYPDLPGRWAPATGTPLNWKYRGQVLQQHRGLQVEIHLRPPAQNTPSISLSGDASLWVDGDRIYEIKQAGISLQKE